MRFISSSLHGIGTIVVDGVVDVDVDVESNFRASSFASVTLLLKTASKLVLDN